MLGLRPHTCSTVNTSPAGIWLGCINHPPYSPDLAPSDFHIFLYNKKSLSGQRQRFLNDERLRRVSHTDSNPGGRLLRHRIQKLVPRYDKCLTWICWKIAQHLLYVPINLPIKLRFVSVNGPRENYFVDALRMFVINYRPTAGVPSSHLGFSMWVLWWTKRSLSMFISRFLPYSPSINFIVTFFTLISFISLHTPLWWCVQAWSAGNLANH